MKNELLLEREIEYLKEKHEENAKRIEQLEAYKAKTEKYGWFLLGVLALGSMLAAGIEKAVSKILALSQ